MITATGTWYLAQHFLIRSSDMYAVNSITHDMISMLCYILLYKRLNMLWFHTSIINLVIQGLAAFGNIRSSSVIFILSIKRLNIPYLLQDFLENKSMFRQQWLMCVSLCMRCSAIMGPTCLSISLYIWYSSVCDICHTSYGCMQDFFVKLKL